MYSQKRKLSALGKVVLAAAVWHVSKERNCRIFQLKENNKIQAFRNRYEDVNVLMRTCNRKVAGNPNELQTFGNLGVRIEMY